MKPEGRRPFKQHRGKHHIKGAPDGGWWCDVICPNKARARREALVEIEQQLAEEEVERLSKLKPCRCGSHDLVVFSPSPHINEDYWVVCNACNVESAYYNTEEEAINDWNNNVDQSI